MREIKFRIWSRHFNQWMNHCGAIDCCGRVVSLYVKKDGTQITPMWTQFPDDDITIQQFTGLKDKNGREIYEGDIVFFDDHEIASKPYVGRAEVFWCDDLTLCDSPQWALWAIGEKSGYYGYLIGEIEVIGNIFENTNLLK